MSVIFKKEDGSTIEFKKFNPYHGPDGRFSSAHGVGGAGGAAPAGGRSTGGKGPNGGPAPDGVDPYEFRSRNVDKKNRAKFDAVDEAVSEGMSTGSRKADNFISGQFNRFCRTGEDKYLNDAARKLYEFTGDPRFK